MKCRDVVNRDIVCHVRASFISHTRDDVKWRRSEAPGLKRGLYAAFKGHKNKESSCHSAMQQIVPTQLQSIPKTSNISSLIDKKADFKKSILGLFEVRS